MENISPQQRLRLALVSNPALAMHSDGLLAVRFATSPSSALRLRRRLEAAGLIGQANKRLGRDDIARNLPHIGFHRFMA